MFTRWAALQRRLLKERDALKQGLRALASYVQNPGPPVPGSAEGFMETAQRVLDEHRHGMDSSRELFEGLVQDTYAYLSGEEPESPVDRQIVQLLDAITATGVKLGIVRAGIRLGGPEALMVLDDIAEGFRPVSGAATIADDDVLGPAVGLQGDAPAAEPFDLDDALESPTDALPLRGLHDRPRGVPARRAGAPVVLRLRGLAVVPSPPGEAPMRRPKTGRRSGVKLPRIPARYVAYLVAWTEFRGDRPPTIVEVGVYGEPTPTSTRLGDRRCHVIATVEASSYDHATRELLDQLSWPPVGPPTSLTLWGRTLHQHFEPRNRGTGNRPSHWKLKGT